MTTVLDRGRLKKTDRLEDNHLRFPGTKSFFALPTNLIPGLAGTSGGRIILGAKAALQAVALTHRETPLVQSHSGGKEDQSFHQLFGSELLTVKAQHPGAVTASDRDGITVLYDGESKPTTVDLYNNYNMGRKTFIHHTATVKVGDRVKKDQILALSNYTDDKGSLALGVNLRTAVMPYRSGNFEDAFVVTESGAKKLEAEQLVKIRLEEENGIVINKAKYVSLFPNRFSNQQISNIDSDGVVKIGTKLHHGDPVILAYSPKALQSTDIQLGRLSKVLRNAFKDESQDWHYEHDGECVDVSKAKGLVTTQIRTNRGLAVGDKLCITPDHDVLTGDGWKPISTVTTDDTVYTLNPSNHKIQLLNPSGSPGYEFCGKMYSLETTQVSMCVTPNHKIYAQRRTGRAGFTGNYNLEPAENLFGKRYKLKKNGGWVGRSPATVRIGDKDIPIKTYLAILGLFLGDGNIFWQPKKGDYGFDISQKKEPETTIIAKLLTDLGFRWHRTGHAFRHYSKSWAEHLKQFGHALDKFIPNWVFGCHIDDLRILYKYLMMTDGSEKSTTHCYTTISPRLASDMQRLTLLVGYSSKINFVKGGRLMQMPRGVVSVASDAYIVYIYRHKNEPEINHGHASRQSGQTEKWEDYDGKVHCLTFEKNHIFYVRRNGKTHWTGNSCAWGAKGVTGSIIPNTLAPTYEDGKPVDILLNSMSITSRVAPALACALGLGKLAEKRGKPVNMTQFVNGSSIQTVIDVLKKHGISDTEKLYDPVTGRHVDVLTGPLYFSRLVHTAEDKQSSRSQGIGYDWQQQPAKSVEESAKRLGNLATAALLSHGATAVLRDIATVKGTKNDEFWRAMKLGQTPPPPKVPFVFNKFVAMLEGAGVKVRKEGSRFNILPLTDKDVLANSSGPIDKPLMFKLHQDELQHETGGLFDPALVGVTGELHNHINLNFAVPNPISEDYLRKLLGVTKVQYSELIVTGKIKEVLSAVNLDSKIAEYRKYLKSGKKTSRDNAVKVLGFLLTMQKNQMHPQDLVQTKIPIIPAQYRPAIMQGSTTLSADVNNLYKDLILNNNELKEVDHNTPDEVVRNLRDQQYQSVKAVYGLGDPISLKHREKNLKGLLGTALGIRGGAAKQAMFQAKVVNKPLDLVGRAVLTPDAKLDLDEASVPQDILWKTYLPFVVRNLVQKGIPAIKAAEYAKLRNQIAATALMQVVADRPAIISRDPSLHKFNLTGFYLKPNVDPKDKTLKLNPLVYKSFNSDNDGDQMGINVPAGEEARLEVIAKMLPSKNLLSPKTMAPIYTPSNEAALGLYQSSTENRKNLPKSFKSEADVVAAYHRGELEVGDNVTVG